MRQVQRRCAGWRHLARGWALALTLALLTGCAATGAATVSPTPLPPTATATVNLAAFAEQTATAAAFGTANAQRLAAMLTPSPVTPSMSPAPTGTPVTVSSPTLSSTTESHNISSISSQSPTATPYVADFAIWAATTVAGANPGRASFDTATNQYDIALTDVAHYDVVRVYAPQALQLLNYTLDVDVKQATQPTHGGSYGVLFRVQPQKPGDKSFTEYVLWIYPDAGAFALNLLDAGGAGKGVSPYTKTPAIRTGNGVNHVQVSVMGKDVTLNLNGARFGPYPATLVAPGTIGLIVQSAPQPVGPVGMEAAFSHLTITPRGGQQEGT